MAGVKNVFRAKSFLFSRVKSFKTTLSINGCKKFITLCTKQFGNISSSCCNKNISNLGLKTIGDKKDYKFFRV